MVFAKLPVQEKEAFFGLLDEYFQSRPELFGQGREGMKGLLGQKLNVNEADVSRVMSVGRVAAASLAFSGSGVGTRTHTAPDPAAPTDAPSLPRRGTSNVPARAFEVQLGPPGSEVDKLVSKKASVFSAFKTPPGGGAVIPPAFVQPKGAFAPPPVRRVASSDTTSSAGAGGAGTRRQVPTVPTVAAEGEWAEVLYDYGSEDPADLAIEAGTRVFVTAKSSEDWWTGQIDGQGREGLFPASYVKLLG